MMSHVLKQQHREHVRKAIAAGKNVRPEVLSDYPELAPQPTPAPAPTQKPALTGPHTSDTDKATIAALTEHGFRRNRFNLYQNGHSIPAGEGWINKGDTLTNQEAIARLNELVADKAPAAKPKTPRRTDYAEPRALNLPAKVADNPTLPPIIVNVGAESKAGDIRMAVIRDANGLIGEIQEYADDTLVSSTVILRDDEHRVIGKRKTKIVETQKVSYDDDGRIAGIQRRGT